MKKFILSLISFNLILFCNFCTSSYANQNYKNCKFIKNIKSIQIQNIFLFNNNYIEFSIPSNYKFKNINPFSLISPSGKQLISIVPQFININQPIIRIYLKSPLTEKGKYQIIFTGIEENTNYQIDLIGEFNYT